MDKNNHNLGLCCHYTAPVVMAFSTSRYIIGEIHGRSNAVQWLRHWNQKRRKPLSDGTVMSIARFIRKPTIDWWSGECPRCALAKADKKHHICIDRLMDLVNYLLGLRAALEAAGMKHIADGVTKALEEFAAPIEVKEDRHD